jgi:chromosome segregation ATPase
MSTQDLEARIREKFERKMQHVARKMGDLQANDELQAAQVTLSEELDEVEAQLEALRSHEGEDVPGKRERLEARRERLLAKQERLELRNELLQDRRDRLMESLEELKVQLTEAVAQVHERAQPRAPQDPAARRLYPEPQSPPSPSRKMQEERRKVLEMVQQGKISADDAAQLLDALRDQEEGDRRTRRRPRWVRIRVTDTLSERVRVNLTLPVGLVRAGLRAGGSIAGVHGLDTAGLEEMLERGEIGHLIDVQDEDGGERVEIFVE